MKEEADRYHMSKVLIKRKKRINSHKVKSLHERQRQNNEKRFLIATIDAENYVALNL